MDFKYMINNDKIKSIDSIEIGELNIVVGKFRCQFLNELLLNKQSVYIKKDRYNDYHQNFQLELENLLAKAKKNNKQVFIATDNWEKLEALYSIIKHNIYWQKELTILSTIEINSNITFFKYTFNGFESFIENQTNFR